MFIKSITIEHFETIEHYESPFDPDITLLCGKDRESVFKAIGVILKNRSVIRSVENIRDDTSVIAEVEAGGFSYRIVATGSQADKTFSYAVFYDGDPPETDVFHLIEKNTEEENLSWFLSPKSERYSERFQHYKEIEEYYPEGDFGTPTNGIGLTRIFRNCLKEFLNNYQPEQFTQNDNWYIQLLPNGRFIVENLDVKEKIHLSESENYLFEFLCFLKINEFWGEIEAIRDFNGERPPLMITELVDRIDVTKDLTTYLLMAQKQNRQIFIGTEVSNPELSFS